MRIEKAWTFGVLAATLLMVGSAQLLGADEKPVPKKPVKHVPIATKPVVEETIKPVLVVDQGGGKYFVDFGEDSFAALELAVDKPEAGKKIVVRLGEKLLAKEQIDPKPPTCVRFLETTITLEADKKIYRAELPERDAKRTTAATGPILPFRYVELEGLPAGIGVEELRAGAVRQIMVHYEFDDGAAAFECAGPKLNAIWKVCKHTMKSTSFAGLFIDGDRERTPYEADAYINMLGWYCCTTDLTLPRYTHEVLIYRPNWPTEWIMFSVLMAWEEYQHSGDPSSAKEYYMDLKAKTLQALERPDGLISTVEPAVPVAVNNSVHFNPQAKLRDLVDWPPEYRDDYDMVPINTVVNAFHYRSMVLMGKIAHVVGKPDEAAEFERAADKIAKSINEKLVDAATGLYVDGEGSKHSSLQGNLFPLAFGLVPPDRREKVLAFIESRKMACNVYAAQFLMEGLFDNGRGDYAQALMTANSDRSWSHMIEVVGATMTLEAWRPKWRQVVDWNHAWGAAPANILPRKVLGVEILEAGASKVLIWPRAGKLAWAKGKVPTAKGPVSVDWKQNEGEFRIAVDLPVGVTGRIGFPKQTDEKRPPSIAVDGKNVKYEEGDNAVFVDGIDAGKHELLLRY